MAERKPYQLPGPNDQAPGYSPTSSSWNVTDPRKLGLDGVLKLASQAGRNEGYNEFMKHLNEWENEKLREKEAKKAENAERAAAKVDLGNEPESPGFWQKMGQIAGEGLERTLDILSRPLYGVAGAYDHVQDKSWEYDKQGLEGWDRFMADIKDLPEGMSEVWKGLSGEDKTEFSHIFADKFRHDSPERVKEMREARKEWRSLSPETREAMGRPEFEYTTGEKWAMGAGGFAANVIADPLTYVGVGLITKPVKAASKAGIEALSKTDDLNKLTDDIASMGIKRTTEDGVEVELTRNQIRTLLGGRSQNLPPKGMSRKQQRQWRNRNATPGKRRRSKSDEAQQVRERLDGIQFLRNKIKNSNADAKLKSSMDDISMIDDVLKHHETVLTNMVNDFGRDAMRQAYSKFDSRPGLGAGPTKVKTYTETFERATSMADFHKFVASRKFFKRGTQVERNRAQMNQALSKVMNDPQVSKKLKEDIQAWVKHEGRDSDTFIGKQFESDPEWRSLRGKIRGVAQDRDAILKAVPNKKDRSSWPKDVQVAVGRKDKVLNDYYRQREMVESRVLRDLVAGDINEGHMRNLDMYGKEYGELALRQKDLKHALDEIGKTQDDMLTGAERAQQAEMLKELDEVEADLRSMREDYQMRNPEAQYDSRYATHPKVTQKDVSAEEWESIKRANIDRTEERLYQQYLSSAQRETREGGTNARLHKMYGGKNDKQFRIAVAGKDMTYSEFKAALKDNSIKSAKITKEDRDKFEDIKEFFAKDSQWTRLRDAEGNVTYTRPVGYMKKTLREYDDELPASVFVSNRGNSVTIADTDLGAFVPLEKIAFDRLFKAQHKMSSFDAHQLRAIDEGKFITYRGNKYTKNQFKQKAFEDPDFLTSDNYLGLSLPKEAFPEQIAERVGQSYFGFQKFKAAMRRDYEDQGLSFDNFDEKVQELWQDTFKEMIDDPALAKESNYVLNRAYEFVKNKKQGVKTHEKLDNKPLPKEEQARIRERARKEAEDKFANAKTLEDVRPGSDSIKTKETRTTFVNDADEAISSDQINEALLEEARREYAEGVARLKMQKFVEGDQGYKAKAEAIDRLKALRDQRIAAANAAHKAAKAAEEEIAKRMDEQMILNMLVNNAAPGKTYARISFAGMKVADVAAPDWMLKATEQMSKLPILQSANRVWASTFHPASKLEPEINLARLRAQARTPDIIKHHLDEVRHTFSQYKPDERSDAMRLIMRGAAPVGKLQEDMKAFFDNFAPYTTGAVKIGDDVLTIRNLNHYLPDEFKFIHPKPHGNVDELSLGSAQEILGAMRNMPKSQDPMKAMWHLKIAAEQAMAYKAMQHTIRESFGVKRQYSSFKGQKVFTEQGELVEDLNRNHGWVTHRDIGDDWYFAPEVGEQIEKLMEMMKPQKVHELLKTYDKVQRIWKSTVTVYNPGYYARNGIGETIMGALDGLTNPKWYSRARTVLRYAMPDDVEEALKSVTPWAKHATKAQQGVRKVTDKKYRMPDGSTRQLSVEDAWVLYSEVGLKSGFISTEYDHFFPAMNTARATPVGQVASKINDGVRQMGEKYEDYFRIAHFMYRIEKSGQRDALKAAEEAAEWVRKYHFDYTDFTPTEKAVMLRLFPFYKWTRKSLPLMASMIFTKPGAVTFYPKAMSGLSAGTGGVDPAEDTNGLMPNYEDVTPEWMQGLFAYPIGRDEEQNMTYMNVATPQMDIYKLMQDPVSATIGLMSPMYKFPLEQGMGRTLDPDFDIDLTDKDPDKESAKRFDHMMRLTPATSLFNNIRKGEQPGEDSALWEPGASPLDERMTSFLSGLGFYENNEKRKMGEEMRRNLEGR